MYAAKNGHLSIVKLLIERGIKIDEKNIKGQTALMYACKYGHFDIIKYLISNKCDKALKDNHNKNCSYYAFQNRFYYITTYLYDEVKVPATFQNKYNKTLNLNIY